MHPVPGPPAGPPPADLSPVPLALAAAPPRPGGFGRAARRLLWLALPAAGVAAYFGAGRATSHAPAEAAPAPPVAEAVTVTADPVTPRPIRRTVEVVGSLYGWEEVPVAPRVEGRVVAVRKDVGDVVRPGDVLLEVDPTDYRLAVAEQERGLELELAKLGLAALPGADFSPDALPAVVKAAAQEKNAAGRNARMQRIGGGSVSAEEADIAAADLAVARANLRQARLDAAATLAAARLRQAALDTARQRLADTAVRAPAVTAPAGDGPCAFTVCGRYVTEGESVRPAAAGGAAAYKLVLARTLKMLVSVPERHLPDVRPGQPAELDVEAYPGRPFAGTVARVNPSVDRGTRTFQAEVHVPNPDGRLRPGCFAKARIVSNAADAAPTVPEEAVATFAGVVKVFVLDGDAVRAVPVATGASVPVPGPGRPRVWVEVAGDLPAGARVATSGLLRLADGTKVTVRDPLPPAGKDGAK